MRFVGREEELATLERTRRRSEKASTFTIVLGRRRIGKTALMLNSAEGCKSIYLFVSRISESMMCGRMQAVAEAAGIAIYRNITEFRDLFNELIQYSKKTPLTLMIDEFQDFMFVNPSVYSSIQEIWDINKDDARMNLIVSGSSHSLMVKIFENEHEPLFGRATSKIVLRPFKTSTLKQILQEHNPDCCNRDLLTLYMLTGGAPYYVSALMDSGAVTSDSMIEYAVSEDSIFLRDGRDVIALELGRGSMIYFTIMRSIASGHERRGEMEDILKMSVGPYLERLRDEYGYVKQISPVLSKPNSRNCRWVISDQYLKFYFRYILPNADLVEVKAFDLLRKTIKADLESYEGRVLEDYLRMKIAEEWEYSEVGGYWNRTGDLEIDIVVIDKFKKSIEFIEVERNPAGLNPVLLEGKAARLDGATGGYAPVFRGLSMDDM